MTKATPPKPPTSKAAAGKTAESKTPEGKIDAAKPAAGESEPRKPTARRPSQGKVKAAAKVAAVKIEAAEPAPPKALAGQPSNRARKAKFGVGQVVRHRIYPFRGVIFDIDPVFNNTEEWWQSIPEEVRPRKDQPFYHLLAENAETTYIAYVSEQNLLPDGTGTPVRHPQVKEMFAKGEGGQYRALFLRAH